MERNQCNISSIITEQGVLSVQQLSGRKDDIFGEILWDLLNFLAFLLDLLEGLLFQALQFV